MTIAALLALAVWAASARADDAAIAAARQAVQEAYGQRLTAVGETEDDPRDDVALAEELIAAARQADRPAAEQFALADQAVALMAPLGTQDAGDVARKAMTLADSIMPYPPADKAQRRWQIVSGRVAHMQRSRADLDALRPVVGVAARTGLEYVELLLGETDDPAPARQVLSEVRSLVNRYKLDGLGEQLDAADARIQRAAARSKRISEARAMLAQATEQNNPRGIAAAGKELADAYISFDGDLLTAAQYIDGTGHVLTQAVQTVAAVHAGELPDDPDRIIEAVVALRDQMAELDEPACTRVGEHALALCEAYLARAADGEQRVTGRLHRMQINKLLGRGPADVMLAALSASYKASLHGRLQILDEERVRITYDFDDAEQLADWAIQRHDWQVSGALVHAGANDNNPAAIATRLRFRADRRLRVSLRASAFDEIAVTIAFHDWGKDNSSTGYRTSFRGPRIGRTAGGLELITPRDGRRWTDGSRTLNANAVYDIELVIDGAGGVTWSIDGAVVHQYAPAPDDKVATDGFVTLVLLAQGASVTNPTGYDNVVMEGCVLPEPNWKPEAD